MAYLYRHIRLDTNLPFYIGIGSGASFRRAHRSDGRSKFWRSVKNKTKIRVEIIMENLSWEEACEKEKEFIALYGVRSNCTGSLVNLTMGGEGAFGRRVSEATRRRIGVSVSGANHGMYRKSHTREARSRISEAGSKRVINTQTGEVFSSVKVAAAKIGLRPNTLSRKLSGIRSNNTTLKYY